MRDPKKKTAAPTPTEAILESISDGVVTVDWAWRISSFNRAAETFRDLSPRRKPPCVAVNCGAPPEA